MDGVRAERETRRAILPKQLPLSLPVFGQAKLLPQPAKRCCRSYFHLSTQRSRRLSVLVAPIPSQSGVWTPFILQQSLDCIVESFQAHWSCFEMLQ
jgi:hypothetical protein